MILKFREIDRDKFDAIVSGTKSVETRAATPKYRALKPGDNITAVCGADSTDMTIKSVSHFPDVASLLKQISQATILPGTSTVDEAEAIYYSFPGYKEKVAQFGLLAFELE